MNDVFTLNNSMENMVFESERMSGAYDGPNRMAINTYDEG